MKRTSTYYFLCAVIAVVLVSCSGRNSIPSLEETFVRSDKLPFGTYVAFREINELFYRNDVAVKKLSIDQSLDNDYDDTSALFICISKNFYLRSNELASALNYVRKGNSIFISAARFDSAFLQEMDVVANSSYSLLMPSVLQMKKTNVHLAAPYFADSVAYSYYYLPLENSFTVKEASEDVKVLGTNENGQPNFVVVFYGKGRFYLHCEPRVFSNYFLLQDNNYKYLQRAFSFVPSIPDHVFWDDFYNRRNRPPSESAHENDNDDGERSGLSVLLKYPAMAWGFWLTLLLLLLYLLFGSKRRQRIIKPIASTENTSVAFTETVGRLYLQNKDNRNIADKMITYLLEHIRNQYFLSTNNLNDDFTTMLSRKSNTPKEEVEEMMGIVKRIQRYDEVDDALLLSLNKKIENFYKHK
ncbi:MAG: DUF4350 domain-containing protein [Bacteroidota bacterium]